MSNRRDRRLQAVLAVAVARALATALLSAVAAGADASPVSRALTRDAFALAYDLQFTACYALLEDAITADPADPAPHRAMAAVTWIEVLFTQGVATFEAFTDEISKSDVIRPPTPPHLDSRFRRHLDAAASLSARQLGRADDADSHYQVGATAALSALYAATVQGRTLGAFGQGRRAVGAMERVRERDRNHHEAALVLGMSAYTVSTMSWPVRALARLSGLSGDRENGLALLQEAAQTGAETRSDALLLLMIIDNRERRYGDALPRLAMLQAAHAHNRLLALNHGAAAMLAGLPLEADRALTPGIERRDWEAGPALLGEAGLWFAHRGTARAQLKRPSDARADLERGLAEAPRDWVKGRIHRQLGELALAAGDRLGARRHFAEGLAFSDRGGDRAAVREAKQRLALTR